MRIGFLTLIVVCSVVAAQSQTTEADHAADHLDFQHARELYRKAIEGDPDPKQRDLAALRLANIEWRLDHDAAAAERDLARIADDSERATAAFIEVARLHEELRGDFAAAATAAQRAQSVAKNQADRQKAVEAHAYALLEPIRRARLAGRCEGAMNDVLAAKAELSSVIADLGPLPAPARELLDAAILSNDGATALTAFRGYYGALAESTLLKAPATRLARALPAWKSANVSAAQRRSVGLALADARFFTEAALVLRDPCARKRIDSSDPRVSQILAYDAITRALQLRVNEYYRNVALKQAKPDDLRKIAQETARSLWSDLSWRGKPAAFSESALEDALNTLFGAYLSFGNTGDVFDVHFAHRVVDEKREVTQYGASAPLRFIALDSVVSNGFWSWIADGRSGDGGWANETAIYQVRPLYASEPYELWLKFTDPSTRAQHLREIDDESRRDEQRIVDEPELLPRGAALRLRRQYVEEVLRDLDAKALRGTAKRNAFVARVTHDVFEASIWAHEGRHAIDKKHHFVKEGDSAELEFRAKLSEVALAPSPREAINAISYSGAATTPHGAANRRIGGLLTQWMRDHADRIVGIDTARPMLLQVDKLIDEQLRDAFRSMDPLARKSR